MDNVDFLELASYCVNRYKESHSSKNNEYVCTLYVAITEANRVLCSSTPHILRKAHQCILINQRSTKANTNWYSWFDVEYIDENGCVRGIDLGRGFKLYVTNAGQFSNMMMFLDYENNSIYKGFAPWDVQLTKIWELYTRVKDLQSKSEIELIAELFRKDETILKLEKEKEDFKYKEELLKQERNQYKDLLDEIKNMVEFKSK